MSASKIGRDGYDVAIVGGGFSGVMVALNIARTAPSHARVVIVERREAPGRGTAYAKQPDEAVLNVPAGAMGAFPDAPGDFAHWLGLTDLSAFVPRRCYGDYLQALLGQAQSADGRITCIRADVADIERRPPVRALVDRHGATIAVATHVVLAVGAPPPADLVPLMPDAVRAHPAYVADPWTFLADPAFAPAGEILVAGSGLTALDVIAAFARSGRRNRLRVVSRRGRFPLAHAAPGNPGAIAPLVPARRPPTIRELVRSVRRQVREAAACGIDWRTVVDALRPQIPDLWTNFDLAERQRYLRHVRPLFDPHRHRAPATLLAQKDALVTRGQLVAEAARIIDMHPNEGGIDVILHARGAAEARTLRAAQVINCAGPANIDAGEADSVINRLIARGEVSTDPTGLGLRTHPDGRLIDACGGPSDLYTIGWPMRGTLLETTAVRELRSHAQVLGRHLARARASDPGLQCGA